MPRLATRVGMGGKIVAGELGGVPAFHGLERGEQKNELQGSEKILMETLINYEELLIIHENCWLFLENLHDHTALTSEVPMAMFSPSQPEEPYCVCPLEWERAPAAHMLSAQA